MDTKTLVPITSMDKGDPKDEYCLGNLASEAQEFLLSQSWCKSVKKGFFGLGNDGIFGVFLFEIVPFHKNVDNLLWVVTGDLPPAYLVCDMCPNPQSALESYIVEMRRWVNAVCQDQDIGDDIITVNVPPTKEYAEMLRSRLEFLEKDILDEYEDHTEIE